MFISIFGMISLLMVIIISFLEPSMRGIKILFILLGLQIIFIFRDGFFLFYYIESFSMYSFIAGSMLIMAFIAWYIWLWIRNDKRKIRVSKWILIVLIILCCIYTEFYNGFYSFDDFVEYQTYYEVMKEHYYLIPFKLTKDESQHHQTDMPHPNCECEVSAKFFYFSPFFPRSLSLYEGTIYFYIGSEDQRHTYWIEVGQDTVEQIYTIYNQRRGR